ncbi:MAG: DVUA0089 family protein, partial [Pirellulales bacterium]
MSLHPRVRRHSTAYRSGRPRRPAGTKDTILRAEALEPRLTLTGDTIAAAANLGTLVSTLTATDAITPSTDIDMYRFTVQAGQRVAFDIDRPSGSRLDSYLRLFNSGGSELRSNDDGPAPGEPASVESYLEHTFATGGTYFIGVTTFFNRTYNPTTGSGRTSTTVAAGTGAYTLRLSNVNTDPDDQIPEAAALGTISQLRFNWSTIDAPGDVDMYRFNVTADRRRVRFDIDRQVPQLDSILRLFNAGGTQLALNDDGPNPSEATSTESYIEYEFPTAGTYYVGVSGFSNTAYDPVSGHRDSGNSTGDYMLLVSPVDSDPDDEIGQAIVLGSITAGRTVAGDITPGVDVDMYSFTVTAGQRIAFDIDRPAGSTFDSFLRWFDARGNELASNDDGPTPGEASSTESYLEFTFPSAGTFYLGVSGFGNQRYNALTGSGDTAGSTGGYVLSLAAVDPDPDDAIPQAIELGAMTQARSRSGAIDAPGTDVDMFSFVVTAGQRVGFDIDRSGMGTLDSYLRLFDASGRELRANDDGPTPGEAMTTESYLEYMFTTAGTYYVGVSGFGNSGYSAADGSGDQMGSSGGYTLIATPLTSANDDPDDQIGEAIVLGALSMPRSADGGITTPGDVDIYAFIVTAGQDVMFDVDVPADGGVDAVLRLFNASGTELAANNDGPNPGEPAGNATEPYVRFSFATAGTYYIGVSGSANASYNATTGEGDADGSMGGYRLVLTPAAMMSPDLDDQISEAVALGAISGATSRSGQIDIGPDVDMFAFTVTAGQTVNFDIDRPAGGTLDSVIRLFNASGTELAANDDGPHPTEPMSVESYLQFTFATAGTYYLGISGFSNVAYDAASGEGDAPGSTGGYVLAIDLPGNDPDDTLAEATPLGAIIATRTVSGAVGDPLDVDLFSFSVAAGQRVSFDIDRPAGSALDSFLRLFDSTGTPLAANDNGPTMGEVASNEAFVMFTFETAGTYFLGVSGSPNTSYNPVSGTGDRAGSTGAYALVIETMVAADVDNDDQISEATVLGTIAATETRSVPGVIGNAIDVDIFAITVVAGQKISFDIDRPTGGALDSYLRIFDSTGTVLAFNDDGPTPGENATRESFIDYTFPTAGTFYIGVSGYANTNYDPRTGAGDVSGTMGAYTLVIGSTAPMPTGGFNITLTFSGLTPSQQAIFNQASTRWSQIITGDLPDVMVNGRQVDDVVIDASAVAIDGPNGVLGQAGPRTFRFGSQLPSSGIMQFDSADMAALEANGKLLPVILHEMGHVLGIGTIWSGRGLLTGAGTTNPRFTGSQAVAAFNSIFGRNDSSVPVEGLPSGPGSRDSHWRESVFGPELMSPFISFN